MARRSMEVFRGEGLEECAVDEGDSVDLEMNLATRYHRRTLLAQIKAK